MHLKVSTINTKFVTWLTFSRTVRQTLIMTVGREKPNTTYGYFINIELHPHRVSMEQLHVSAIFQAIIRLIIYPTRGNYTTSSVKSFVSDEISFSSIKFHVPLNSCKIYSYKIYKNFDNLTLGEGCHVRQYIVLLPYYTNAKVFESCVVS